MKRNICSSIILIFFIFFAFLPKLCWPQMTVGQYEDEAPLRTWNTFGFSTAPSLARGETRFTLASDCSTSLSNPALLTDLPKFTLTLNSSVDTASLFKYSIVNTGVLYTDGNSSLGFLAFDFAGASMRIKNWTFALSIALLENYLRPAVDLSAYTSTGDIARTFIFDQQGNLKNINFSVARRLFGNLSAGIGLNYAYGFLEKNYEDDQVILNFSITDRKYHEFESFYINGGLVLDLTQKIKVAAVFRTPFLKKADSESLYRYYSPTTDTEIRTEASELSEYKQPLVVGLGVSCTFSSKLRAASDFTFYDWSEYSVVYFGEEGEQEREFKDIIKVGAGLEYLSSLNIFGQEAEVPFRAGVSYDPQPMKEPDSAYLYFSLGTGIHWKKIFLDMGMLVGGESGSGNSLRAKKMTLSLSFRI
ncbi:MAG: hypothetical protein OEY25_07615 [Candidatus Aminicenantes bacterium]|nr:hypothetical protein [Candidatus Aminicenantes bacterium]